MPNVSVAQVVEAESILYAYPQKQTRGETAMPIAANLGTVGGALRQASHAELAQGMTEVKHRTLGRAGARGLVG